MLMVMVLHTTQHKVDGVCCALCGPCQTSAGWWLQVGGVPDDWDCYDRAEVIPSKKPGFCRSKAMRRTLVADADYPAAEVAGYTAAALAAGGALLQRDDPEYAVEAMKSAYAVWKFGEQHNKSAATWSVEVVRTYGVDTTAQIMLYGAAMIAWAHRCGDPSLPLCREAKAQSWLAIAEELWQYNVVRCLACAHHAHLRVIMVFEFDACTHGDI